MRLSSVLVASSLFIGCAQGLADTTPIDFAISEGTNLAFDISPDGETIVFDLLGQLWLLPVDGGEAHPLTNAVRDTAEDVDPTFSPDGRLILFQTDRPGVSALWLVPAEGGQPMPLTPDGLLLGGHVAPSWSPDGSEIAYALRDTIYRLDVRPRGTRAVPIEVPGLEGGRRRLDAPSWAPDGRGFSFGTGVGNSFRFSLGANARIWEVGDEGGVASPVTGEGVRAVGPAYSPDGRRIAYFAPDSLERWQLWVNSGAGETGKKLTDHEDMAYRRVRWTPNRTELVYSADGKLWRISVDGGTPEEIPFTARVRFERHKPSLPPVRFPSRGSEQPARGFRSLELSPEGDRIAMIALGQLWVWPVASTPRSVADLSVGAHRLSWSPDGSEVVYADGDLYSVNLATGLSRRITALQGEASFPVWSPDGRNIAFIYPTDGCYQRCPPGARVRMIDAGASMVTDLFEIVDLAPAVQGFASFPTLVWRADSRTLLTYTTDDRTTGTAISLDGETAHLETFPSGASFLTSTRPDTVVYTKGNRLWQAVVDSDSGLVGQPWALSDDPALYVSAANNGAILYVSEDGLRLRRPDGRVTRLGWPVRYDVPEAPRSLLIRNARVIDGTGVAATGPLDLSIADGRIIHMDATGTVGERGATDTIDARGRTVIPGLVDLHRHLFADDHGGVPQAAGALYYGTTTVRDVGSTLAEVAALRDVVESGRWPGPRVIFSGVIFQGADVLGGLGNGVNQYVGDPEQIARGVAIAHAFGSDYVKYRGVHRWGVASAIVQEAHRRRMRISGHCGSALPVVAAGIGGQEHSGSCYRDTRGVYADYAQLKVASGSWLVPTAGVWLNFLQAYADPTYFERPDVAPFLGGIARSSYRPDLAEAVRPLYEDWYRWDRLQTAVYHEAGVTIATGTDNYLPGAVHSELEALVESGLSALEAITAGTSAAAGVLGAEAEIGTVEVGKLADLVILDADPLQDITNTRRVWRVIKGGQVVDRDALLRRVRSLRGRRFPGLR